MCVSERFFSNMTFGSVKKKNWSCLIFNRLDNSLDYFDIAVFLVTMKYSLYVLGLREQIVKWFFFPVSPLVDKSDHHIIYIFYTLKPATSLLSFNHSTQTTCCTC